MVMKVKVAIEFADELAESPTWRANCWCLAAKPTQGYPYSRIVGKGSTSSGTRWCKELKDLDRFGPRGA